MTVVLEDTITSDLEQNDDYGVPARHEPLPLLGLSVMELYIMEIVTINAMYPKAIHIYHLGGVSEVELKSEGVYVEPQPCTLKTLSRRLRRRTSGSWLLFYERQKKEKSDLAYTVALSPSLVEVNPLDTDLEEAEGDDVSPTRRVRLTTPVGDVSPLHSDTQEEDARCVSHEGEERGRKNLRKKPRSTGAHAKRSAGVKRRRRRGKPFLLRRAASIATEELRTTAQIGVFCPLENWLSPPELIVSFSFEVSSREVEKFRENVNAVFKKRYQCVSEESTLDASNQKLKIIQDYALPVVTVCGLVMEILMERENFVRQRNSALWKQLALPFKAPENTLSFAEASEYPADNDEEMIFEEASELAYTRRPTGFFEWHGENLFLKDDGWNCWPVEHELVPSDRTAPEGYLGTSDPFYQGLEEILKHPKAAGLDGLPKALYGSFHWSISGYAPYIDSSDIQVPIDYAEGVPSSLPDRIAAIPSTKGRFDAYSCFNARRVLGGRGYNGSSLRFSDTLLPVATEEQHLCYPTTVTSVEPHKTVVSFAKESFRGAERKRDPIADPSQPDNLFLSHHHGDGDEREGAYETPRRRWSRYSKDFEEFSLDMTTTSNFNSLWAVGSIDNQHFVTKVRHRIDRHLYIMKHIMWPTRQSVSLIVGALLGGLTSFMGSAEAASGDLLQRPHGELSEQSFPCDVAFSQFSAELCNLVMSELSRLSRFQHACVAQIFQCWIQRTSYTQTVHMKRLRAACNGNGNSGISSSSLTMQPPPPLSDGLSSTTVKDNLIDDNAQHPKRTLCIQMEHCAGQSLRQYIDEGHLGSSHQQACWACFRQILEVLEVLHRQHLYHRALHPLNIFLEPSTLREVHSVPVPFPTLKIADFGVRHMMQREVLWFALRHIGEVPKRAVGDDRKPGSLVSSDAWTRATCAWNSYAAPEFLCQGSYIKTLYPELVRSSQCTFQDEDGEVKQDIESNVFNQNRSVCKEPETVTEHCILDDGKADMFSLGLILLDMFHGPFRSKSQRRAVFDAVSMARGSSVLTEALKSIQCPAAATLILRLTDPDPLLRPSAAELLYDASVVPSSISRTVLDQFVSRVMSPTTLEFSNTVLVLFSRIASDNLKWPSPSEAPIWEYADFLYQRQEWFRLWRGEGPFRFAFTAPLPLLGYGTHGQWNGWKPCGSSSNMGQPPLFILSDKTPKQKGLPMQGSCFPAGFLSALLTYIFGSRSEEYLKIVEVQQAFTTALDTTFRSAGSLAVDLPLYQSRPHLCCCGLPFPEDYFLQRGKIYWDTALLHGAPDSAQHLGLPCWRRSLYRQLCHTLTTALASSHPEPDSRHLPCDVQLSLKRASLLLDSAGRAISQCMDLLDPSAQQAALLIDTWMKGGGSYSPREDNNSAAALYQHCIRPVGCTTFLFPACNSPNLGDAPKKPPKDTLGASRGDLTAWNLKTGNRASADTPFSYTTASPRALSSVTLRLDTTPFNAEHNKSSMELSLLFIQIEQMTHCVTAIAPLTRALGPLHIVWTHTDALSSLIADIFCQNLEKRRVRLLGQLLRHYTPNANEVCYLVYLAPLSRLAALVASGVPMDPKEAIQAMTQFQDVCIALQFQWTDKLLELWFIQAEGLLQLLKHPACIGSEGSRIPLRKSHKLPYQPTSLEGSHTKASLPNAFADFEHSLLQLQKRIQLTALRVLDYVSHATHLLTPTASSHYTITLHSLLATVKAAAQLEHKSSALQTVKILSHIRLLQRFLNDVRKTHNGIPYATKIRFLFHLTYNYDACAHNSTRTIAFCVYVKSKVLGVCPVAFGGRCDRLVRRKLEGFFQEQQHLSPCSAVPEDPRLSKMDPMRGSFSSNLNSVLRSSVPCTPSRGDILGSTSETESLVFPRSSSMVPHLSTLQPTLNLISGPVACRYNLAETRQELLSVKKTANEIFLSQPDALNYPFKDWSPVTSSRHVPSVFHFAVEIDVERISELIVAEHYIKKGHPFYDAFQAALSIFPFRTQDKSCSHSLTRGSSGMLFSRQLNYFSLNTAPTIAIVVQKRACQAQAFGLKESIITHLRLRCLLRVNPVWDVGHFKKQLLCSPHIMCLIVLLPKTTHNGPSISTERPCPSSDRVTGQQADPLVLDLIKSEKDFRKGYATGKLGHIDQQDHTASEPPVTKYSNVQYRLEFLTPNISSHTFPVSGSLVDCATDLQPALFSESACTPFTPQQDVQHASLHTTSHYCQRHGTSSSFGPEPVIKLCNDIEVLHYLSATFSRHARYLHHRLF